MQRIRIIDSHTGGEPTRLVIGGFPDLGQGDMPSAGACSASATTPGAPPASSNRAAATYWSAPCSAHRSIPKPVPE